MDKLVLLDSNSLLNRAFYALPPMTAIDGRPTNAVYGYINMLLRIISDIKPSNIVATFDLKAPTFRKQIFDDYKALRKPMPEELAKQMPIIKELLTAMKIQILTKEGFEADDLIGTLAKKSNMDTIIVTGDKDSLQLVSPNVKVWLTKRGITEVVEYDEARLAEEGMTPSRMIDLKALMGDASDNIPGVKGVGEKTARNLLSQYQNLDDIYANIDNIKGKLKELLVDKKEMAYLSYKLGTIVTDCPVDFDKGLSSLKLPFDYSVKNLMQNLNFKSIISRLEFAEGDNVVDSESQHAEPKIVNVDERDGLKSMLAELAKSKVLAIYAGRELHLAGDNGIEYICSSANDLLSDMPNFEELVSMLTPLFEDVNIRKISYDIKTLFYQLYGAKIVNYDDIALKIYLLDANRNYKNAQEAMLDYGYNTENFASIFLDCESELDNKLKDLNLTDLYENIELPLVEVLYDMETYGMRVDLNLMQSFKESFTKEIIELSKLIYDYNDGKPLNLNSPKQLGTFLFDKLGLKHGKKTKTGYSTNAEVLESLKSESEAVELILRYREINKLLTTYIDGLNPLLIGDRVHTIFKQNVTSTGRLSSTEPNLQNIPIRKADGKKLRKMFIASDDCKLLCADYSQIELRLMAHFSGDEILINAFEQGDDIHTITASKAFNVPLKQVDADLRRKAKAINFGIIYGISEYGLASDIGVPIWEAKSFIENYFKTYPKVKNFMDNSVIIANEKGYISTLLGRIRYVPELKSTNYNIRQAGERIAMNMPLQGSASDIIKIAMINVHKALKEGNFKAKLMLQVHDELLIDCPINEIDKVTKLLNDAMTNALKLRVKLVAEVSSGDNWLEAK